MEGRGWAGGEKRGIILVSKKFGRAEKGRALHGDEDFLQSLEKNQNVYVQKSRAFKGSFETEAVQVLNAHSRGTIIAKLW